MQYVQALNKYAPLPKELNWMIADYIEVVLDPEIREAHNTRKRVLHTQLLSRMLRTSPTISAVGPAIELERRYRRDDTPETMDYYDGEWIRSVVPFTTLHYWRDRIDIHVGRISRTTWSDILERCQPTLSIYKPLILTLRQNCTAADFDEFTPWNIDASSVSFDFN